MHSFDVFVKIHIIQHFSPNFLPSTSVILNYHLHTYKHDLYFQKRNLIWWIKSCYHARSTFVWCSGDHSAYCIIFLFNFWFYFRILTILHQLYFQAHRIWIDLAFAFTFSIFVSGNSTSSISFVQILWLFIITKSLILFTSITVATS